MAPLILITGFSGTGKTALLAELLPLMEEKGFSPTVILNDAENASQKAKSLPQNGAKIIPIEHICVCCNGRETLLDLIATIPRAKSTALIISADQAADSIELLEALVLDERTHGFLPPTQVAVVDAMKWQRRDAANQLEGMQFITAPYTIVNRLGELKSARKNKVQHSTLSINPFATPTSAGLIADVVAELSQVTPDADGALPASADCHFSTLNLRLVPQISRENLSQFLNALPKEVIRAKGIASFDDSPGRYSLFQKIDGVREIDFLELEDGAQVEPLAVFIGPNMPSELIRKSAEKASVTCRQSA